MPGGRVVAVEVGGWEIECCVAPPGIGDRVRWPLVFHRGAEGTDGFDRPAPTTRTWRVERQAGGATFLVDGPLVAYWSERDDPAPAPGVVEATGVLSAALHGGATPNDPPTVAGIVRRLWVISQVFVPRPEQGPRCVGPVAGTLQLRTVDRSPQRFESQPITTKQGRRREVGLLVELDLGIAATG